MRTVITAKRSRNFRNSWIRMPFSHYWIMHIEACLRIENKIDGRKA
ncbi:hypothetical protein CLOHYLEM_06758 [[Clostridium] hylemonae DSM 15053]|uniref:Uncharacterized protein n=1 Tax=[Clostridium] hylemonae DSM 15053 TaxID=553973 RepID=C0C3U6_9FIRM|nr:hypothetical protein CLOHYLEM_06758 [[Clostridium] hylemonae DSM 15053]